MMKERWVRATAIAMAAIILGGLFGAALGAIQKEGIAWAAEEDSADPNWRNRLARGVVTAVDGNLLSVQTESGMAQVVVTDQSELWAPGKPPTSTLEVRVGDPLLAFGKPEYDDSGGEILEARLLAIASDDDLANVLIRGRVVVVTRQTIVVQTGRRERAVTVLPRTRLISPTGRLDSLRDIHRGDLILALGQPTEVGQWIAGVVLAVAPRDLPQKGLRGQVTAKSTADGNLAVQTMGGGDVTVLVDKNTRYRIPEIQEPGFDDVQVGDQVIVAGHFEEGEKSVFVARGVVVRPRNENMDR